MSVQKTKTPVKKEVKRREKKRTKPSNEIFVPSSARKDTRPVNPNNDKEMVTERLRQPLFIQDPEWHKKTKEEREALSKVDKIKNMRASSWYVKESLLKKRVTVYLKNPEKLPNFKTTYSDMIESHKLVGYLELFFGRIRTQISKIYYDNKPYRWSIIHKKQ